MQKIATFVLGLSLLMATLTSFTPNPEAKAVQTIQTKTVECQMLNWAPGRMIVNSTTCFLAGEYYVTVQINSGITEATLNQTLEFLIQNDGDLYAILNYLEQTYDQSGPGGFTLDFASGCYWWQNSLP